MVVLLVHFLVTFSSCNSWALVSNNVQISTVLNQMCKKALNLSLADESQYAALSVNLTVTIKKLSP